VNTIWSDYVQGIQTLYRSRKLRFDDMFFEQYNRLFDLDRNAELKILEIGCGPGALAESLRRWYPKAQITAIDRDSNFISFAKENIAGIDFMEGDVTQIPFEDNSFDVTISNTVQEHVEPNAFWGEQMRVLKPGGICLCLSARKGISCIAPCLKITEEEKAFWDKHTQDDDELGIGAFAMSEAGIPASMENGGFIDVSTGYAVIDLTPDAPKYPAYMAESMIEANRHCDLEAILSMRSNCADEVIAVVNAKYDERIRLYREGNKQWDSSVSVTMIIRGRKPQII